MKLQPALFIETPHLHALASQPVQALRMRVAEPIAHTTRNNPDTWADVYQKPFPTRGPTAVMPDLEYG